MQEKKDNDMNGKRKMPTKTNKKRKVYVRDPSEPKPAVTGYMFFSNEKRGKIRAENPAVGFGDISKAIAEEWNNLPADQKQHYLDLSEQDKERYHAEFAAYKQTQAYRDFQEAKKKKNEEKERCKVTTIPIFTEEFLEYNKQKEAEVRRLRKNITELEQQIAVLEHHLSSLHQHTEQLQAETLERRKSNMLLQQHLQKLKAKFIEKFADFPLSGTNELPTAATIDQYISKLHTLIQDGGNEEFINKVKDIINDMDIAF